MGFWAWFWIWVGLVIGSLAVFALIGLSLFNRGMAVAHQFGRIAKAAEPLMAALDHKPALEDKESDVLGDLPQLEQKRRNILNRKSRKRAARQRSLRTALKHIDVNESRFTNVR